MTKQIPELLIVDGAKVPVAADLFLRLPESHDRIFRSDYYELSALVAKY